MFSMFKSKKPPQRAYSNRPAPMGIPTERVRSFRAQGYSDPEIIRSLRDEGYSPLEVDKAMKESMRGGVASGPSMDYPRPGSEVEMHEASLPLGSTSQDLEGKRFVFPEDEQGAQPMRPMPGEEQFGFENQPQMGAPAGDEYVGDDVDDIPPLPQKRSHLEKRIENKRELEETVESVVDEKWMEFERKSGELNNKMQILENKITNIEKFVSELQSQKKTEFEEIKGLIGGYKTNMEDITGKMSALENAMKDSLTPMMQSLRSLSETIKLMRERKRL